MSTTYALQVKKPDEDFFTGVYESPDIAQALLRAFKIPNIVYRIVTIDEQSNAHQELVRFSYYPVQYEFNELHPWITGRSMSEHMRNHSHVICYQGCPPSKLSYQGYLRFSTVREVNATRLR